MAESSLLGPKYTYADELAAPSEIGVRNSGSVGGIIDAMAGVNYYVDAIGFGHSTALAAANGLENKPLGISYFVKTGSKCSNGADMYEYINTIPQPMGGRVGNEVQRALGVKFQGLAPGIMQDAASALNPMPLFKAVIGSGYARCKKVTLPVGDYTGAVASRLDGTKWITDPIQMVGDRPHQTRWVYDNDIEQEEYNNTPKTEGFAGGPSMEQIAAGVLCGAVILGLMLYKK